jgi:hypothetical protein
MQAKLTDQAAALLDKDAEIEDLKKKYMDAQKEAREFREKEIAARKLADSHIEDINILKKLLQGKELNESELREKFEDNESNKAFD